VLSNRALNKRIHSSQLPQRLILQQRVEQLRQRQEHLNRQRIERALSLMTGLSAQVFRLMPVLLHYNHPLLPGYVDGDIPTGISQFTPDGLQQQFVDDLLCMASHRGLPPQPTHAPQANILGLYAMGSTSSVGQCGESDLDIWVCHRPDLPAKRRALLERKCLLLSKWAEGKATELNFFLIPEDKFRLNGHSAMSRECCGSAQHLLLLDEFYRSALKIAGRPILWPVIDPDQEAHYDQYVQQLVDDGVIQREEWLDLGGFERIPAEEYFGATLWLLYKGIDSPYKAVLKTLLMEAYSWEYPNTRLLSTKIKRYLHEQPESDLLRVDAYRLMLSKVTRYLTSIGDHARLELARRCFYLKTYNRLSQPSSLQEPAWKRGVLRELVTEWGWSDAQLCSLDNRCRWKINEVKAAYAELLDAMMLSYRNLLRFARVNHISESINPEDIGILTRKLYAAFESLPGKVTMVNPQISPDLSEPHLTLIEVPPGRTNGAGWYLYKFPLVATEIMGRPSLERSSYLSKLVAWSYFNGLLVESTRLDLYCQRSDLLLAGLQQFVTDLSNTFPVRLPAASNQALKQPCEIRHLGIFVNLELDPTSRWGEKIVEFDINNSDIFCFGEHRECLVGSVDLIYRNSWNEMRTLHFSGDHAVVDALATILGKMHQHASAPDAIDVFCYSEHFRGLIRSQVQNLVMECVRSRLSSEQKLHVKTLAVAGDKFGLFFEAQGVTIKKLESAVDFYSEISHTKLQRLPLRLDNRGQQPIPDIVFSHASEGLVQFFFERLPDECYSIYIVDESNRVERYQNFRGRIEELIQGVNRFYTSSQDQGPVSSSVNFNLPQFYEIVTDEDEQKRLQPYSYRHGRQQEGPLSGGHQLTTLR